MNGRLAAWALGLFVSTASVEALADGMTPDWRRADRKMRESPQSFAFEARIVCFEHCCHAAFADEFENLIAP